jgi:hypothetical protein
MSEDVYETDIGSIVKISLLGQLSSSADYVGRLVDSDSNAIRISPYTFFWNESTAESSREKSILRIIDAEDHGTFNEGIQKVWDSKTFGKLAIESLEPIEKK